MYLSPEEQASDRRDRQGPGAALSLHRRGGRLSASLRREIPPGHNPGLTPARSVSDGTSPRRWSGDNFLDDLAGNIGQAEVTSLEAIRQLFVVKAEQV